MSETDSTKKTREKYAKINGEFYSSLIQKGFRWRFNCLRRETKRYVTRYEVMGLDVAVGSIAFTPNGKTLENSDAIFTR